MSDSERKQNDQTQFDSRENRHYQVDKGTNSLSQGLEKETVQGATSAGDNGADDGNRSRLVRKSKFDSRSGRSNIKVNIKRKCIRNQEKKKTFNTVNFISYAFVQ